MDILTALSATPGTRSGERCKIGRWLDEIPDETEGKGQLVATFEADDVESSDYRTLDELTRVAGLLGLRTSRITLMKHRRERCRCHGYSA